MTDWIVDVINAIGYLGVAFLSFIEVVIPIIPSEIVLPFSGFAASQGELSFIGVLIAATIGSVLGSYVIYWVASVFGWEAIQKLTAKYGKYLGVRQKDVDKAGEYFEKYEYKFVFFGRFIPGVRSVIAIPAGLKRMKLSGFILMTTLGALVWNILLVYAGYRLGEDYDKLEALISPLSKLIFVVLALSFVIWLMLQGRKKS